MSVQRFDLMDDTLAAEVGMMTPEELDALPFGAIQLDAEGTVLSYNKAEERISGRTHTEVVGRNFFREVAPCTRVQRFFGAFQAGVDRGELNEVFDFTFRFAAGARDVRIRMILGGASVWIFVTPMTR
jgi:photoactive yellow protein